jgi:hypothetical protein
MYIYTLTTPRKCRGRDESVPFIDKPFRLSKKVIYDERSTVSVAITVDLEDGCKLHKTG